MKKICLFLVFCALIALCARAEDALPVLRLDAAQLDYVAVRPGTLRLGDFTSPVTVKYRGTYSVTFTGKRNYSLHLKDENGRQRKESLLGLRRDDDYVLLGGLSDPSRLRNPVGLALWRALGHPAPDTAACELHFGPYYKGVYFLTERPDRKSAGVPSDGALYRVQAEKVNGVDLLTAADPGAPTGENWYNLSRIWPETDAGWQPLRALLEDPSLLDREAFADYYLYVNLIGAADNMTKNLFLCWDGQRFYPMPWDLDAAFGRLYTGAPSDPEAWYSAPLLDRLLADAFFQALLRERWALWRDLLAPENVMARFEALYRRIDGCGAWTREAERFPVYTDSVTGVSYPLDPAGELDFIRAFLTRRFALLNAAYGGSL